MELLQFDMLLYSVLEEVNAEYDALAALPREQNPPLFLVMGIGRGVQGSSGDFGKGKIFICYRDS